MESKSLRYNTQKIPFKATHNIIHLAYLKWRQILSTAEHKINNKQIQLANDVCTEEDAWVSEWQGSGSSLGSALGVVNREESKGVISVPRLH